MAERLPKVQGLPTQTSKVPPQALDAEVNLLGAMLIDSEVIHKIVDMLRPEDFYKKAHQKIYLAAVNLFQKDEPPDVVTLGNELRRLGEIDQVGGAPYLAQLAASVATSASVQHYAKIIREKAMMRHLISVATGIVEEGYGGTENIDGF